METSDGYRAGLQKDPKTQSWWVPPRQAPRPSVPGLAASSAGQAGGWEKKGHAFMPSP